MEWNEIIALLMFGGTFGMLMLGFPVAFTIAGTALLTAFIALGLGLFEFTFLQAMPNRIYDNAMKNEVLLAVPLFVFMGVMLEKSKVAEELLENMGRLFGSINGGLGISVFIVGALLAASTGIVGATVVTMGLISLPTMLKYGYSPRVATGVICASGTLGQIIPPSIVLVILGDQLSNAYVDAQRELGNWSPEPVSVGDLFAGAMVPGVMLVGLYILYQVVVAIIRPSSSPAMPEEARQIEGDGNALFSALQALLPPVILIIAVLGSILVGVATPTEAASVGAVGAVMLAGWRLSDRSARPIFLGFIAMVVLMGLVANFDMTVTKNEIPTGTMVAIVIAAICCAVLLYSIIISCIRTFGVGVLQEVMRSTAQITSLVFVIVIGAAMFSLVFRGLGGDDKVHEILSNMPGGKVGAIIIVMLVMFILGFFLDFIEITFVVVPIVAPIILKMDVNPIWLGIMMAMNLQTSFLTPPFGFALFYLRGVAPPSVTTIDIYRGVAPFVLIQILALGILAMYPELTTWLPKVLFGTDLSTG